MKGEVGAGTWRGSKKETIWNRNYVLCMLVSACASFAQSMFNPAMPVYGQTIGLSADIIGMITGVATFICMFGRGITGKLSDTMSKKCLVWTGLAFTISGYILYFFARSMAVFFAARILQTVGSGIQITVLSALAISVVPSKRIPSAIAIFSIASSLAQCFAPNIGTNLAYGGHFTILFTAAPVLILLAAFLVSRIEEGPISDKKFLTVKKKGFSLDKLICFPAVPAAILLLFNGLIHTCISNYLSLYGLERNLENVGFFFTINAVTMIAVRPLTGRLCDRHPLALVIIPGYIGEMATALILALTSNMIFVAVAAVFYGIGFGSVQAAIQIMAVRSVGPERRGDANGTFYVGGDIGLALGAYGAGAIFDAAGSMAMYLFMASMAVLCILFYIVYQFHIRLKKQSAPEA